jgi:hypothetical protein
MQTDLQLDIWVFTKPNGIPQNTFFLENESVFDENTDKNIFP